MTESISWLMVVALNAALVSSIISSTSYDIEEEMTTLLIQCFAKVFKKPIY